MALDPAAAARLALSPDEPVTRRVGKLRALHQHVRQIAAAAQNPDALHGGHTISSAGRSPPLAPFWFSACLQQLLPLLVDAIPEVRTAAQPAIATLAATLSLSDASPAAGQPARGSMPYSHTPLSPGATLLYDWASAALNPALRLPPFTAFPQGPLPAPCKVRMLPAQALLRLLWWPTAAVQQNACAQYVWHCCGIVIAFSHCHESRMLACANIDALCVLLAAVAAQASIVSCLEQALRESPRAGPLLPSLAGRVVSMCVGLLEAQTTGVDLLGPLLSALTVAVRLDLGSGSTASKSSGSGAAYRGGHTPPPPGTTAPVLHVHPPPASSPAAIIPLHDSTPGAGSTSTGTPTISMHAHPHQPSGQEQQPSATARIPSTLAHFTDIVDLLLGWSLEPSVAPQHTWVITAYCLCPAIVDSSCLRLSY
jgi:hypothetical protein